VKKFTIKSKHTYPLLEATIRDDDVWAPVVLKLEVAAAAEVEETTTKSFWTIKGYLNIKHK
jgi:hypothetical protein